MTAHTTTMMLNASMNRPSTIRRSMRRECSRPVLNDQNDRKQQSTKKEHRVCRQQVVADRLDARLTRHQPEYANRRKTYSDHCRGYGKHVHGEVMLALLE